MDDEDDDMIIWSISGGGGFDSFDLEGEERRDGRPDVARHDGKKLWSDEVNDDLPNLAALSLHNTTTKPQNKRRRRHPKKKIDARVHDEQTKSDVPPPHPKAESRSHPSATTSKTRKSHDARRVKSLPTAGQKSASSARPPKEKSQVHRRGPRDGDKNTKQLQTVPASGLGERPVVDDSSENGEEGLEKTKEDLLSTAYEEAVKFMNS